MFGRGGRGVGANGRAALRHDGAAMGGGGGVCRHKSLQRFLVVQSVAEFAEVCSVGSDRAPEVTRAPASRTELAGGTVIISATSCTRSVRGRCFLGCHFLPLSLSLSFLTTLLGRALGVHAPVLR